MTKTEATEMMIKNLSTSFDPNLFETCYTKSDVIEAVASFVKEGFDETLETTAARCQEQLSDEDAIEFAFAKKIVVAVYRQLLLREGFRQISHR